MTNATVDVWPDISEMDADELFATAMTLTNGSPAKLYSAFNQKTVLRHFKWMKDNNLDDGQALPSDWYLRVADQAGKMLRGHIPLQSQLPIVP